MKFDLIVCGGTFDVLHKGHKSFLLQVFDNSKSVIIGVTSNSFVSKFKDHQTEDFMAREANLKKFLDSKGLVNRYKILEIDDIYGPLLDKELRVDALAITPNTNNNAENVNNKRKEMGLSELNTLVIEMDLAEDGREISSTRIRNGEINRDGRLYVDSRWVNKKLVLPEELRKEFQNPLGKLLSTVPSNIENEKAITIGDITTQKFNEKNIYQYLSIIDFVVKRKKMFDRISDLGFPENTQTLEVDDPPGQISWNLFDVIKQVFKTPSRKIIQVNGEEDLAVLAVILVAPLGYMIYYGQPNDGLVEVEVTEDSKEKIFELLSKFEIKNFDK